MDNLPIISPRGEPVGNENAGKRIRPPNGVPMDQWVALIELAAQNFRNTSGVLEPTREILEALDIDEYVTKQTWNLVFNYPHNVDKFKDALVVRGVLRLGKGLTPQQSMAIDVISNPSMGSFKTRLRKCGITETQWSQWLLDPIFAEQFNNLVTRRMNSLSGIVDTTLTQSAIDGNLEAIKYYDKRHGRDPDKRSGADGKEVAAVVIDVMTRVLAEYPDLLRKMAAELEVRLKLNG